MLQASVQLPAVDAAADTIMAAFQGAYGCCDVFWKGVFAHLPAAKAAKSDGAADFKLIVEAMLAGIWAVWCRGRGGLKQPAAMHHPGALWHVSMNCCAGQFERYCMLGRRDHKLSVLFEHHL